LTGELGELNISPVAISVNDLRRLTMHSEFRFPMAAKLFMTFTLILVLVAIEKGNEVSIAMSRANLRTGSAQWMRFALLPGTLETFFVACFAGAAVWCILFALRRSGVQRLSDILQRN
jgi:cbb3-type cytochrome oxidase subunit 1